MGRETVVDGLLLVRSGWEVKGVKGRGKAEGPGSESMSAELAVSGSSESLGSVLHLREG